MQNFIKEYLISGPIEINSENLLEKNDLIRGFDNKDVVNKKVGEQEYTDQFEYEKHLRNMIVDRPMATPERNIQLGEKSELGIPWQYHYDYGNWFVDFSHFYSQLRQIEMLAVTGLYTEEARKVDVILWSYAAVSIWCNSSYIGGIDTPVYKPIKKQELQLDLKEGYNEILIRLQNLGVRDTRTIFAIELIGDSSGIKAGLDDRYGDLSEIRQASMWLDNLKLDGNKLTNIIQAPSLTSVSYGEDPYDFADVGKEPIRKDVSGQKVIELELNNPYVHITCEVSGMILKRHFEKYMDIKPIYGNKKSFEENRIDILEKIAEVESLNRDNSFGFAMANILARRELGKVWDKDEALLYETLNQIENRYDCADFMIAGFIRYMKKYPMDVKLEARAKEVLTNFRYWMNHEGSDAMCFWSENHSLLFYSGAMFCGELYPDTYFTRAKMYGNELSDFGRKNVLDWLEDIEKEGFEEFLASIYMSVTFVALLNLIDFGDEEISEKATKIADKLLIMIAKHTFDGAVVGPMGRVYKDVLYPFEQGGQALVHLINPDTPYQYSEGWLGLYATSKYQIPKHLVELMDSEVEESYTTGNARVHIYKKKDYVMTSVESPRQDKDFQRWENLSLCKSSVKESHLYTKSLNERFHGTTCFEPGVYGYQQHLWYGALDNQTPVFVNQPGVSSDTTSLRPGYWFGNGIVPLIKQVDNIIGSIYVIPKEYPIHFTHAFWPNEKFDERIQLGRWLFARKNNAYIALWCNKEMELYQGQLANCEYRTYGSNQAYICVASDKRKYDTFKLFIEGCFELNPSYDEASKSLTFQDEKLIYKGSEDLTQFI